MEIMEIAEKNEPHRNQPQKRRKNGAMKIDIEAAKERFERYLDGYDRSDDKIRLKIVHTYGVVGQSRELTARMGLCREDRELAELIALLHDIGRFEQLRRYSSFQPDTMDHAAYGVQLLFGEGRIREFVPCPAWDPIIKTAVEKHSDFVLEGICDPRALLHARLIRDEDKLDNCRVKLEDAPETFLGATAEEIGAQKITPKVLQEAMAGNCILSSDRRTLMDHWVSYVAYFFDLNFKESLDLVREQDYVRKIIRRIPYTDPDTRKAMEQLEEKLLAYLHTGSGKHETYSAGGGCGKILRTAPGREEGERR